MNPDTTYGQHTRYAEPYCPVTIIDRKQGDMDDLPTIKEQKRARKELQQKQQRNMEKKRRRIAETSRRANRRK